MFKAYFIFVSSRCVLDIFPDGRDCHVELVMVAEVARWATPISPWVGVSYLISAVALSLGTASVDVFGEGWVGWSELRLPSLANHLFCFPTFRV